MEYLPVTVHLLDQPCLIVGGGEVAYRKLKHLLRAGAQVSLVAENFNQEIIKLAEEQGLELIHSSFNAELLTDQYLVIAATDNPEINQLVSQVAKQRHIWVNVVDDLELSNLLMPAVVDRSPLLVAISTGGVSPVLARIIREKLEWLLPKNLSALLDKLKTFRPKVKKKYPDLKTKRSFAEWFIETSIADKLELDIAFEQAINQFEDQYQAKGKVYLVGAGPGAPDLLTVKALKILQKADVVLHDALVGEDVLELIRKDAKLINVGKRANNHSTQQAKINQLLVTYGKQHLTVVRLKGGDPFIYGRGGEELEVLVEHQIDFEVVPGITAASACASYAGIPLTHRQYSQTVMFITAHCKNSEETLNWKSIARQNQTLVVYMGLLRNEVLTRQMIRYGRHPDTPVAIVEKGTSLQQRVITGTLNQLPDLVTKYQLVSPALIIIGEVAALASQLNWYPHNTFIQHPANSTESNLLQEAV